MRKQKELMDYKLGYLSTAIICSLKLTVLLELNSWKSAHFSEQIMSTDKYPSSFLAIVFIILQIFFASHMV